MLIIGQGVTFTASLAIRKPRVARYLPRKRRAGSCLGSLGKAPTAAMLSTMSRRIVARGLRPSALALHRVRMCQSAAAQPEVKVTIEGPAAASSDEETAEVALEKALRPKEIVEQLDRYIIGQPEAKRAVAVAMRNRWRRQRVASPLKEEVCCRARSLPYPALMQARAHRRRARVPCSRRSRRRTS